MYATSAFEEPEISGSYEDFNDNDENSTVNPMSVKLKYLDISHEDTDEEIYFCDLPKEEQEVFVDLMLQEEREQLTEKLEIMPELITEVEIENEATKNVIATKGLTLVRLGTFPAQTYNSIVRVTSSFSTKSSTDIDATAIDKEIIKVDASALFAEIRTEVEEVASKVMSSRDVPSTKGYDPRISSTTVKNAWAGNAK